MKAKKLQLLAVSLLVLAVNAFATHNRAGYISYTCVKNGVGQYTNTYHFKIITYTNPSSTGADRCYETLVFTNIINITGRPDTLNCPRTNYTSGGSLISNNLAGCGSESNISPTNPGDGLMMVYPYYSGCGNTYGGMKFNTYEGNYTFNGTGTYIFGMVDANLDNDIINVPSSVNVVFAILDTLRTTTNSNYNNSPLASNVPDSIFEGQAFHYNLGMVDADNDSLSYSLIPFITGTSNCSSFYPVTGAYIPSAMSVNAVTGDLSWLNVVDSLGEYDVDILIREYRRVGGTMIEVGSIVFVLQLYVTGCAAAIKQITNNNEQVTIYPNPAKGIINIKLKMENGIQNTTLQITDMLGNIVEQSIIYNLESVINITDLNDGVYTISISSNEGVVNKRLVIVR